MKYMLLLFCIFTANLLPTLAEARIGRCLLQVNGKTYINGPCAIDDADKDGSFTIGVGKTKRTSKYFAYVNIYEDGAHAYWNETPDATHAHTSLGILKKKGACWENNLAKICAYK